MPNEYMSNENMNKVAIIGRTNVGKSTLFNRLIGRKKAIVSPRAGTTRDRNFGSVSWNGKTFTLIDTGGLEDPDEKKYSSKQEMRRLLEIEKNIKKQALVALKQADLVIFILDIKDGIMPQDQQVANLLRKSKKPVVLAINKATSKAARDQENAEYYKLGLGEPTLISATTGTGTGDLLDAVTKNLPKQKENNLSTINSQQLIISIIGRPNVGKSSLLNLFAGEQRSIVSSQPHTTREAQEIIIEHKDQAIKLIDTAGVRRKSKIDNHLEKIGVKQSLETLKDSNLILFIVDSSEPLAKQDQSLARLIKESNKPTIILANKWDLVKGIEMFEYETNFKKYFPHLSYAPFIFISCKNKRNIDKILDTAIKLSEESSIEITKNALSKFLTRIMGNLKKFQGKSKTVPRLLDLKQISINPPAFEIIMKDSKHKRPHPSTIKYVENQIRQKFNLKNIPVRITLRTIKIKP
ncbi:ribosome biogenesis GTPase Der [Candidatus Falkowbacteria bacterium]|nr:ribosome biogenesis GTPase Der [Candidatus Falkowbacteria bacterium]